jgi:hypothetical protein
MSGGIAPDRASDAVVVQALVVDPVAGIEHERWHELPEDRVGPMAARR